MTKLADGANHDHYLEFTSAIPDGTHGYRPSEMPVACSRRFSAALTANPLFIAE